MKPLVRTLAPTVLATGLVALVLPWSSAEAGEEPAFAGYNTSAWAAPVKVELYEPTIPIPASPQFELELGYTKVEAETGLARGRGSWLWPGDPLGEGAKTFADQLGLPEQVGEAGYPAQVNAEHPSGQPTQRDEPFPGTVMRTSADGERVSAEVGYSSDGEVQDHQDDDGDSGDPALPGLPTDGLEDFGDAITGESGTAAAEPVLPPELTALVDVAGYASTSEATTTSDLVRTVSRSSATDVSLFGGLLLVEGVSARMVTTSDGTHVTAAGTSRLGTLSIAGNEFTVGPDGVEAAGQTAPIQGLPDDPARALQALGIELLVSTPREQRRGDQATGLTEGLQVVVDTSRLRSQLGDLPLADVIGAVPDEAQELKSLLQAAAGLSPRIVITLGNAGTATATVQALDVPPAPTVPAAGSGGDRGTGGNPGGGEGPALGAPGAPADDGPAPAADGDLVSAAPVAAGLPPLNSVPGALLVGGVGLAAAAGTWLRKAGVLALGGAGSCPHGLDTGLPDLRKA
jgi:hypothetical protein